MSIASAFDLKVDDAVVLNDSNRLTLRLLPCDVVARVAPMAYRASAAFEVELAQRLSETESPVAALEPRVEPRLYERDGFVINMWTYYEPVSSEVFPAEYAGALQRLHAGMRLIDVIAPHFTDRVADAQSLVADRDRTPELDDGNRQLLGDALRSLSRRIQDGGFPEQLLHGEPHPGNVLNTREGPLFVDLETCCRGPIEFDIAHAPVEVSEQYPDTDREVLRLSRALMRAMVTTWRWDRDDQHPDGRRLGLEGLGELRAAVEDDAR